jgi:hypothetical protein
MQDPGAGARSQLAAEGGAGPPSRSMVKRLHQGLTPLGLLLLCHIYVSVYMEAPGYAPHGTVGASLDTARWS